MIDSFKGEYFFLSNFYECEIKYDGLEYSCVENAFQAQKTLYPADRVMFSGNLSPSIGKRLGRSAKLRSDWENIKDYVMKDLIRIKFKNPELREKLLATGDEILVEGNTWNDHYWGKCDGYGYNMLGQILMLIRDEIRKEIK
jgi:ribA/ribD-fused uncharacterized protein